MIKHLSIIAILALFAIDASSQVSFLKKDQIAVKYRLSAVDIVSVASEYRLLYFDNDVIDKKTLVAQYDSLGNLITSTKLTNSYNGSPDDFQYLSNGNILLNGTSGYTNYNYVYEPNGNVIWSKSKDSNFSVRQAREYVEGSIVGQGEFFDPNGEVHAYSYSRLDLAGDTVWNVPDWKLFSKAKNDSVGFWMVSHTYFLGHYYSIWRDASLTNNVLFKIDTTGRLIKSDTLAESQVIEIIGTPKGVLVFSSKKNHWEGGYSVGLLDQNFQYKWRIKRDDTHQNFVNDVVVDSRNEKVYILESHRIANSNFISKIKNISLQGVEMKTFEFNTLRDTLAFSKLDLGIESGFILTGTTLKLSPWESIIAKTTANAEIESSEISIEFLSSNAYESILPRIITIFPNPTSSSLSISMGIESAIRYGLINSTGQSVKSGNFQKTTQLDVSDLPNGIYFLQLQGEGVRETRKVVISR